MTMWPQTTRVIELTPAGRAAVAVILVTGQRAVAVVDECLFRFDNRRPSEFPANQILVGRWGSSQGEELVVCKRSEEAVEIHCHGGVAAVRAVVDRLIELDCQKTTWQDWLRENMPDPIRAAAQIALAEAPTTRTAAILLDQFQGALTIAIHAALDAATSHDWPTAIATFENILAQRDIGLHLAKPWRVAIAGRPNVGKSSLMNALVGFQRAIVCDLPGTTRDVVTATTAIDGWPIVLADTAGLRETCDEIELAGVALARAAAVDADLILMVDDGQSGDVITPAASAAVLRVLTKIDLPAAHAARAAERHDLYTSVVTGEGIPALVSAIASALVPVPPAPGVPVPFLHEHVECLEIALAAARRNDAVGVSSVLSPLLR
jgi:tRNA modification GTPase